MLKFRETGEENIGRADVLHLVTLDGNCVSTIIGLTSQQNPLFLIKLTYRNGHEYFTEPVPTGSLCQPYIIAPYEYLITNGEDFWEAVRHRTPESLAEAGVPQDPAMYVVDNEHMPPRLQRLTTIDKQHVLDKIKIYCEKLSNDLNSQQE